MTDDPRTLARDVLVLKELANRVAAADRQLRAQAGAGWEPGDRMTVKVGDQKIGTVSLANGRVTARVTDAPALLAWVKATYASEVHTVEEIRPAFLAKLLGDAKDAGQPVDARTGEAVPGVEVGVGDPYVTTASEKHAAEVIAAAWASGELVLPASVLPAVEGGQR